MSEEPKRWSGWATQSKPWQDGYDWGADIGPHCNLGAIEAAEAAGYDFDSPEDHQWQAGAEFALNEVAEGEAP